MVQPKVAVVTGGAQGIGKAICDASGKQGVSVCPIDLQDNDKVSYRREVMVNRLFVYGTLAPGRANEHLLSDVPGSWEPATVTGKLLQEGWGAAAGYPGIVLNEHGDEVHGFVFASERLAEHWSELDEFEGEGYERVLTKAKLKDGRTVEAYIYELRKSKLPAGVRGGGESLT